MFSNKEKKRKENLVGKFNHRMFEIPRLSIRDRIFSMTKLITELVSSTEHADEVDSNMIESLQDARSSLEEFISKLSDKEKNI